MTPYEAVYGQRPHTITTYLPGVSKVQSIDTMLQVHTIALKALKDNLHMAQNRMKQQANQHHLERVFQEGDHVFLRLQTYKQTSLKSQGHQKLEHNFYGPYHLINLIGSMSYKLSLPITYKIHLVFHVSFLKKVVGHNCRLQTILLKLDE